jgi:polar amino acid transport system substrate-binding protein
LRAGINIGNELLVSGSSAEGVPFGVSPDMANEIGRRLGVPVTLVPFARPNQVAEAIAAETCDIGNIGAEAERAKIMAFTAAYAEIEATYIVPAGSPLKTVQDVDSDGVRIAVAGKTAYDLWLVRNLEHATLVQTATTPEAEQRFVDEHLEALAGLRPTLIATVETMPGAILLDGQFTAVQQAMGCKQGYDEAAAYLAATVEELKASGFVMESITRHHVVGLSVPGPA